jgi:hypothetical protein
MPMIEFVLQLQSILPAQRLVRGEESCYQLLFRTFDWSRRQADEKIPHEVNAFPLFKLHPGGKRKRGRIAPPHENTSIQAHEVRGRHLGDSVRATCR